MLKRYILGLSEMKILIKGPEISEKSSFRGLSRNASPRSYEPSKMATKI